VSPETGARLRLSLLLFVGILLQTTLVPDLRVAGVAPDLMLLLSVCAGLAGGAEMGGIVGFTAGLLADAFLQTTPLGLSALTFCLIGFSVGVLRRSVLHDGRVLASFVAMVGSTAGVLLFVLIGVVVGQSQLTALGARHIIETALLVGLMNGLLAVVVHRVVGWAAAGSIGVARTRADNSALTR